MFALADHEFDAAATLAYWKAFQLVLKTANGLKGYCLLWVKNLEDNVLSAHLIPYRTVKDSLSAIVPEIVGHSNLQTKMFCDRLSS